MHGVGGVASDYHTTLSRISSVSEDTAHSGLKLRPAIPSPTIPIGEVFMSIPTVLIIVVEQLLLVACGSSFSERYIDHSIHCSRVYPCNFLLSEETCLVLGSQKLSDLSRPTPDLSMAFPRESPITSSQAKDGSVVTRTGQDQWRKLHRFVSSLQINFWGALIPLLGSEGAWESRVSYWNRRSPRSWQIRKSQRGPDVPIPADIIDLPYWRDWDIDIGLLARWKKSQLSQYNMTYA